MQKRRFEFFNHTADIGIRVNGRSLKELFRNAALSLFSIIAEQKPAKNRIQRTFKIKQNARDIQELFVNWLNELISLSSAKGVIFNAFKISDLDELRLIAVVRGGDIKGYRVNTEIKAVTYHALKIEKTRAGWKAEVIFDV